MPTDDRRALALPTDDAAADRSTRLLPINEAAPQASTVTIPRSPYCHCATWTLILLNALFLAIIDWLPFYLDLRGRLWDQLLDLRSSYDTPVGLLAGGLAGIVVLVALAGARATTHALQPSCAVFLHPKVMIHAVNVLVLTLVLPWWWWQESDGDVSDLFDGLGYISGKACKLMMGLCLLPIARQSLWLNAAATGFPEAIPFHRVTGWWCVAQVVIHSVCYPISEALDAMSDYKYHLAHRNQTWKNQTWHNQTRGPECPGEFAGTQWDAAWAALWVYFWPWATRLNVRTGVPEVNTVAAFILLGLVGTLGAVVLAAFSIPRLRRARYDLFYMVHLPAAALFIVMGAVHDWAMMVFIVPGLFSYFLDRTDLPNNRTASSRFHRVTARARVLTDEWLRLDMVGGGQLGGGALTSNAAYGTQFMYLRVSAIGGEAHAFSLAARCPSIVIKASGDWTRRLHSLVKEQAADALSAAATVPIGDALPMAQLSQITTDLACEIDGVYGNAAPPWRAYSHVLFIGGGVGVAPWLPAMEEHAETGRLHGASEQVMRLVWCGRTHAELEAMAPYLPEDTNVFITRADCPSGTPAVSTAGNREDGTTRAGGSDVAANVEPSVDTTQYFVRRSGTQPWLFAFVGVVSLCLTQMFYYYFRGAQSIYVDYERGCGECKHVAALASCAQRVTR